MRGGGSVVRTLDLFGAMAGLCFRLSMAVGDAGKVAKQGIGRASVGMTLLCVSRVIMHTRMAIFDAEQTLSDARALAPTSVRDHMLNVVKHPRLNVVLCAGALAANVANLCAQVTQGWTTHTTSHLALVLLNADYALLTLEGIGVPVTRIPAFHNLHSHRTQVLVAAVATWFAGQPIFASLFALGQAPAAAQNGVALMTVLNLVRKVDLLFCKMAAS